MPDSFLRAGDGLHIDHCASTRKLNLRKCVFKHSGGTLYFLSILLRMLRTWLMCIPTACQRAPRRRFSFLGPAQCTDAALYGNTFFRYQPKRLSLFLRQPLDDPGIIGDGLPRNVNGISLASRATDLSHLHYVRSTGACIVARAATELEHAVKLSTCHSLHLNRRLVHVQRTFV
mmetsp:Transcript_15630/g.40484  ORF Transcript_15630/g.40484 Transcript_15630/m.40484 type:complete len:174 (-) Transcript_15630:147-668(-)